MAPKDVHILTPRLGSLRGRQEDQSQSKKGCQLRVMWPRAIECRQPLEARGGKGMNFPLKTPEGIQILILAKLTRWPWVSNLDLCVLYQHTDHKMEVEK